MSGISSGVGIISGINTGQLIDQLLSIEGRPKALAQQRVLGLQKQQAAYLDLSGKLGALKTAAQAFRLNKLFQSVTASSTNADVLSASATVGASQGSYTFVVDRSATSQQLLSRAFSDRAVSALGLTSLVVEPDKARLDSDTELSQLNGGNGISRGKVVVTDRSGASTTIDLSRVATVSEVLDAFNSNTTVHVKAAVEDGRFVLTDQTGGLSFLRVVSSGGTTAESLGLAKVGTRGVITGDSVYTIGDNTTIQSLNDGGGIRFNTAGGTSTPDFSVALADGSAFQVDIGDLYDGAGKKTAGPVNTVGELRTRVRAQTGNKVDVQVRADGRGLKLVDTTIGGGAFTVTQDATLSTAAGDLGLVGTGVAGVISGKTVLAGLNSVLASSLGGGSGLAGDTVNITARDGSAFTFTIDRTQSVSDILSAFSTATGGSVTAALSQRGNSVVLTDNSGGTDPFIVTGNGADALGISTGVGGAASATVSGTRQARQYVRTSTLLSTLNSGAGIGSGSFDIIGANGNKATVNISASLKTVGDVLQQINGTTSQTGVLARIDDSGSGIVVEAAPGVTSTQKVSIKDVSGTVAKSLSLVGEAASLAANSVDGTFRRTITLDGGDTLDGVVTKVNTARAGLSASVISDGNSVTPFRLKLGAAQSGRQGRLIVESVGASDLGFSTIASGDDARVFVGADDPAKGILVTRSSNSIDSVIDNVNLRIKGSSATPITVAIGRDDDAIQKSVQAFVEAFNGVSSKIKSLTSYDVDSKARGTLLGDSTAGTLQSELFSAVGRAAPGVTGRYTLFSQVGLTVGSGAQLKLDAGKLKAALDQDPQAVIDLFAAQTAAVKPPVVPIEGITGVTVSNSAADVYTSLGLGEVLGRLADKYTNSATGVLSARSKGLDSQIKVQNDRITDFDTRLAAKRTVLERQFAQMEQSLAQLQRQQSSIGNIK